MQSDFQADWAVGCKSAQSRHLGSISKDVEIGLRGEILVIEDCRRAMLQWVKGCWGQRWWRFVRWRRWFLTCGLFCIDSSFCVCMVQNHPQARNIWKAYMIVYCVWMWLKSIHSISFYFMNKFLASISSQMLSVSIKELSHVYLYFKIQHYLLC